MELNGKAALVTGGGVGTGRAVALRLAERGCHVAINFSHSEAEAAECARAAERFGVRAIAVRADVARDAEVRSMVTRVVEAFGHLDVLVNNAGVTSFIPHQDLEGVSDADWEKIFAVNLRGPFYAVRAAAPALRAARGAVVNVSSIAGVSGMGSSLPYCASKAALNNMTIALARALAPEIRVNAVAPGFIDTRWWQDRDGYEVVKQLMIDRTPLKRICQPQDVARVVVDLVAADLVTGQVLVVDGGMTLGS